jgi:CarboxypepD_reg-like domain
MINHWTRYSFLSTAILVLMAGSVEQIAAQSATPDTSRVRGIVIDSDTGDPLMGVHVFYAGTTIGDASDFDGSFSLPVPPQQQISLVASMIGFELIEEDLDMRIYSGKRFRFELESITFDLEGVSVMGDSDHEWRSNLRRFKSILFGDTDFGRDSEIQNPLVLDLSFQMIQDKLTATSSEPLIIQNRALGYTVTLHGFELSGRELNFTWNGQPVFAELDGTPDEEKKWEKNREIAFRGSLRHFISALHAGRLKEEGFGAYHVASIGFSSTASPIAELRGDDYDREKFFPILAGTSDDPTRPLEFFGTLLVIYNKEAVPDNYIQYARRTRGTNASAILQQSSWLELPFSSVTTDAQGNVLNDSVADPVRVYGYWAWERVGEWLPSDYVLSSDDRG